MDAVIEITAGLHTQRDPCRYSAIPLMEITVDRDLIIIMTGILLDKCLHLEGERL